MLSFGMSLIPMLCGPICLNIAWHKETVFVVVENTQTLCMMDTHWIGMFISFRYNYAQTKIVNQILLTIILKLATLIKILQLNHLLNFNQEISNIFSGKCSKILQKM